MIKAGLFIKYQKVLLVYFLAFYFFLFFTPLHIYEIVFLFALNAFVFGLMHVLAYLSFFKKLPYDYELPNVFIYKIIIPFSIVAPFIFIFRGMLEKNYIYVITATLSGLLPNIILLLYLMRRKS